MMLAVLILMPFFGGSLMPATALAAGAADPYTVLAPLPCIPDTGKNTCTVNGHTYQAGDTITQVDFKSYVQYIVNLAIALSAVTAVFMIVWGGFEYTTSTIPLMKTDGLKKVKNAVFGLILVLASYLILRTIDPRLVQVPDTLVPTLTLNSSLTSNTTGSFLDQLENQLDKNDANYQQALKDIAAAKQQMAQAQKDQGDIEDYIRTTTGYLSLSSSDIDTICNGVPTGSAEVDSACLSRAQILNNEQGIQTDVAFSTAKGLLSSNAVIKNCLPTGNPDACDTTAPARIYNTYKGVLSATEQQQLRNQALYDQAVINMNKQSALLYQTTEVPAIGFLSVGVVAETYAPKEYATAIQGINDAANAYISRSDADPTLVQQLKDQQKMVLGVVQNMRAHPAGK